VLGRCSGYDLRPFRRARPVDPTAAAQPA